jgi:hypothetical protein
MKLTNRFNNSNNNNNHFKSNQFLSKQMIEERNKKQKEDDLIKSLDNSISFPELQKKKKYNKTNEPNQSISFIDAMKTKNVVNVKKFEDGDEEHVENVRPGCVCIKYDKKTKKNIWINGKDTTTVSEKMILEEEPYFIIQRLVNLHQNRKCEYIRKWGIDEYDKMFMFQNYDYGYFDKLDDQLIKNDMKKYYYQNLTHYYSNDYSDIDIGSDVDIDN